jgi:transcriptional regulator with XRE-family HTH domain
MAGATRRGERLLLTLAEEIRDARIALGISQREVARSASMSQSRISRLEAGKLRGLTLLDTSRVAAAVGLDLWMRLFPSSRRPRDAGSLARLRGLFGNVAPPLRYRLEVPLPSTGAYADQRAWDAMIDGSGEQTAVEVELRLYDMQAQFRRIFLKQRDGQPDRLLIVVADTRANRRVLAENGELLTHLPRLRASIVVAALRAGQHPPSGIVLV